MANWNKKTEARNYRALGLILLLATNVLCILFPLFGPLFRVGRGEPTPRDIASATSIVLVSLILPCLPCFILYFSRWKKLAREEMRRWQGWAIVTIVAILCVVALIGMFHSIIIAPYEKDVGIIQNMRLPEEGMEARILNWFTGVAILLVLSMSLGLMPIDPFPRGDGRVAQASA